MTTVLIDGDVLAYRQSAALEECWEDNEGYFHLFINRDVLKAAIRSEISKILEHCGADKAVLALTDSEGNFRKELLPTYKANRKQRRPIALKYIRQWMIDELDAYYRPKLEGDDILGILQTWPKFQREFGPTIVFSVDKDLMSIPGTYVRDLESDPIEVTVEQADRFHLLQTLTGDATDNYSGCPGVGPKAAEEFLENPYVVEPYDHVFKKGARAGEVETRWRKVPTDNVWEGIVSLYKRAGLSEHEALIQARVARICRAADWDFTTNSVQPWLPPGGLIQPELPFEGAAA